MPGSYSGQVSYRVNFTTPQGTKVTGSGNGPITFRVGPTGAIGGTWSFSEEGRLVATGGTVVVDSGTVTGGSVSGTAKALVLGRSPVYTEQLSHNGVANPPSTSTFAFPNGSGFVLAADCSGNVSAEVDNPVGGAVTRIDAHRTGD